MKPKPINNDKAPQSNKRRALIASITAAGAAGLPSQWRKPVVDHILLPAHAQTSPSQTTQGIVTCEDGRIRTLFFEFSIPPNPSASVSVSTTNVGITIDDSALLICTDPVGGVSSSIDTATLTFSDSTFEYNPIEGFPLSLTSSVTSDGTSTSTSTFTTVV